MGPTVHNACMIGLGSGVWCLAEGAYLHTPGSGVRYPKNVAESLFTIHATHLYDTYKFLDQKARQ